jgi:hypothetical protein
LSTVARTGERPRLGYVPNATYPQVAAFLANYRKLQGTSNNDDFFVELIAGALRP